VSLESSEWLNNCTLIGFGRQAWHFNADDQGAEPNHYPHAIPAEDVNRRLFGWNVIESPVFASYNGQNVEIEGRKAYLRSDTGTIVGLPSDSHAVHGYRETLTEGVVRVTGSDLGISSAGLLKGGAVAWVSVSLADTIATPEGVEYLPYLMFGTSLDSSLASVVVPTVVNVVCDNTMGQALGAPKIVKVRHSKFSLERLLDAQTALATVYQTADAFSAQVKVLCEREVTESTWDDFVSAHVPIEKGVKGRSLTMAENKRDALNTLWGSDSRVAPWRGTAYGVVQAVNTYTHHMGSGSSNKVKRTERNMIMTLQGDFNTLDASTLALLDRVQMVDA
jgi:phage/plasmid-like protein (TIGR03299 family)